MTTSEGVPTLFHMLRREAFKDSRHTGKSDSRRSANSTGMVSIGTYPWAPHGSEFQLRVRR